MSRLAPQLASVIVLSVACGGFGAQITEVLPAGHSGGGTAYPPYIEVYAPFIEHDFDLVVFDAFSGREDDVQQVVTISPIPGIDTYLIYEGEWSTGLPAISGGIAVEGLELTSLNPYGTARTLALYDGVTGFEPTDTVKNKQDGVVDAVTYSFSVLSDNHDLVQSFQGEPIHLNDGEGIIRIAGNGDYTDEFLTGPVTARSGKLFLDGQTRMTPGMIGIQQQPPVNPVVPVPTPTALAMSGILGMAALAARPGRGRRKRRR